MTLIVSLRTSDGTVVAGDSLSTMRAQMEMQIEMPHTCKTCSTEERLKVKVGGIPFPTTTLSYAQKIFPFMDRFGVGTYGAGQLSGQTMHFAIRELEQELKKSKTAVDTVTGAAQKIGDRALQLLKKETPDWKKVPDDKSALGFQVVGYHDGEPRTIQIDVGKKVKMRSHGDLGVTVSGQQNVVLKIWELYSKNQLDKPAFNLFSLQDAIDYAEFLIRTTADHQKFSRTLAGVGGDIDVALVTPFDGFRWIKQKSLTKITDPRTL